MLYKVTPLLTPPQKEKPKEQLDATGEPVPKQPRKRRKAAVYDADGHEVLITMMCLKCKQMKPLLMFGLRKMADGAIRNQPWCRTCRSGATAKKPADAVVETDAGGGHTGEGHDHAHDHGHDHSEPATALSAEVAASTDT